MKLMKTMTYTKCIGPLRKMSVLISKKIGILAVLAFDIDQKLD